MSTGPNNIESAVEHRLAWLTRLLGVGVLALVAATWKLWTPQDVFPRVPLFRWAPPDWWDWTSLGLIVVGGCGLGIGPSRLTRPFSSTLASGLAIAFLCDQHRLQPWAWQFFILAILLALADKSLQWHGWRWLVISIYFYSALSKFDREFLDSIGHVFAMTAFGGLFNESKGFPPGPSAFYGMNYAIMWLFPVGELCVALLLAIRRSRVPGMWAAIGMHGLLLQILGPFGLNHSLGVLMWNVFFVVQDVLLFSPRGSLYRGESLSISFNSFFLVSRWQRSIAMGLMSWVLFWPASYRIGACDAWLAWALYVTPSPHGIVDVDVLAFDHKPQLRKAGIIGTDFDMFGSVAGPWSLRVLRVPAYPNLRSDVATALDIAERFDTDYVRLMVRGRQQHGLECDMQSAKEIHAYAKRFWFNAYPTSMYRRAAKEKMRNDDG